MAVAGTSAHENWSSRAAFILAAVGSAVGLGNIWKFPYEAGQGGGGAFVIIYLLFVFAIGVPVMIAELSLGRRGHMSPPNAVKKVAQEEGQSTNWSFIGWLGVIGALIVLSFYSVIAGWTLTYMIETFIGSLAGVDAAASQQSFNELLADPWRMTIWHFLFMGITVFIVARGIRGGLEKAVTWLMPLLFFILVVLVIYSMTVGDGGRALNFLFAPDFSNVTSDTVVQALGQAFFSLSLALGAIMTYGAYLPKDVAIPKSAVIIAGADTLVAILAGLAIFPIVFAYGLEPGSGPGLIFVTLPIAFAQMPGGIIIGGLFFLLLSVAALTSSISLLEPAVSRLEELPGMNRRRVTVLAGTGVFVLGLLSVLSFNVLSGLTFGAGTIFANLDFLTNNIMMPLGGLLIAVFATWFVRRATMRDELISISDSVYKWWHRLASFAAPVALVAIFFSFSGSHEYVLRLIEYAGWGTPEEPAARLLQAVVVVAVLLVPTLLAAQNRHHRIGLLFFVNIVAGWTPIGWLFCLYWAHRPEWLPNLRSFDDHGRPTEPGAPASSPGGTGHQET